MYVFFRMTLESCTFFVLVSYFSVWLFINELKFRENRILVLYFDANVLLYQCVIFYASACMTHIVFKVCVGVKISDKEG